MKQLNLSNDLDKEIFSLNDKILKWKLFLIYKLLFIYYKSWKNYFQNSIKSLNKQLQDLFSHSFQNYNLEFMCFL